MTLEIALSERRPRLRIPENSAGLVRWKDTFTEKNSANVMPNAIEYFSMVSTLGIGMPMLDSTCITTK